MFFKKTLQDSRSTTQKADGSYNRDEQLSVQLEIHAIKNKLLKRTENRIEKTCSLNRARNYNKHKIHITKRFNEAVRQNEEHI